jgi:hypothetical protein
MPNSVTVFRLAGSALYIAALPALMLLLAGDARWIEGWLFAAWFVGLCATVVTWLYRRDPALLAERFRRPGSGGQGPWDRAWVYVIHFDFIAWLAIMPLDARRFGWTPPYSAWVKVIGFASLLASFFLFFARFATTLFCPRLYVFRRSASSTLSPPACMASCGTQCIWVPFSCSPVRRFSSDRRSDWRFRDS